MVHFARVDQCHRLCGRIACDNLIAGWWHAHPFFCKRCPVRRRRRCALSRPVFSTDDRALHRAVFGRGFDLALLLSDLGTARPSCDLFGWRRGVIAARGFYVLGNRDRKAARGRDGARP